MAATVEQICNQALLDAGIGYRIGNIYEGSSQAKVALELYGQARDEILRLADWSFSRRIAQLTLLKGPPPPGGFNPFQPWTNVYANPGFLYEYAYPSDCLDLRTVMASPGLMPDLDPLPAQWRVDNDPTPNVSGSPPVASGPAAKVILCNINQALAVYRAQITDPNEFDSGFTAALVASLGEKFSAAFGADVTSVREQKAEAVVAKEVGSDVRG